MTAPRANETSVLNESQTDSESLLALHSLDEYQSLQGQRFAGVRTVLIVLSSKAMIYDVEALRQKVLLAYPEAAVFFMSTSGQSMGVVCPRAVDLVIDLTGPGQRQGWFFARKLKGMAKHIVGRNAGLFRKKIYDRIFDEKADKVGLPDDFLERERAVQKRVLSLAGVPVIPSGGTTADLAKKIALELPPMADR